MNIGEKIRQRRVELGLSQTALAKKIGIKGAAVSLWETGGTKTLKGDNLLKVAKALEVSPEWLIGSLPRPAPAPAPARKSIPATSDLVESLDALVHLADPDEQETVVRLIFDCIRIPSARGGLVRAIDAITSSHRAS
ncbi:HTH-type transcriptional regulator, cell division transcriptional repressor [Gammaproteobacteria bacterium]